MIRYAIAGTAGLFVGASAMMALTPVVPTTKLVTPPEMIRSLVRDGAMTAIPIFPGTDSVEVACPTDRDYCTVYESWADPEAVK